MIHGWVGSRVEIAQKGVINFALHSHLLEINLLVRTTGLLENMEEKYCM